MMKKSKEYLEQFFINGQCGKTKADYDEYIFSKFVVQTRIKCCFSFERDPEDTHPKGPRHIGCCGHCLHCNKKQELLPGTVIQIISFPLLDIEFWPIMKIKIDKEEFLIKSLKFFTSKKPLSSIHSSL